MRHGKKFNHLGRQANHRKAMLANMSCSLIEHKRINTTVAKAKALKKYIEPLLTRSKVDSTHSRRVIFSYLNNKEAVSELFREVAPKIINRPGGYLRLIRTENRLGDNAEMCMIELVDFNTLYTREKSGAAKKSRTRRAGSKKADTAPKAEASAAAEAAAPAVAAAVAEVETPVVETPSAEVETPVAAVETPLTEVETPTAEAAEEPAAEAPDAPASESASADAPADEEGEEPKKTDE